jgi:hypothetical protein
LARAVQLTDQEILSLVATEPLPVLKAKGRTKAERILSLLLDDRMRLGPRGLFESDRDTWIARVEEKVSVGQPLQFVMMGCPYKVPSLVKTSRVRADLGEFLMFRRLTHLVAAIRSEYGPGADVIILVEGILGRCTDQDSQRVRDYQQSLPGLLQMLGQDAEHLHLFNLEAISESILDFDRTWATRAAQIGRQLAAGDPQTKLASISVIESMRTAVPVLGEPDEVVLRAYTEGASSDSSDVRRLAARIDAAATIAFARYMAFLQLRDESGFVEKIAPGALKLTVAPKRGNIGSIPINSRTHILPYHGVPVRLPSGPWSIRYLVDVQHSRHHYSPVHRIGDPDPAPIGYVATA